MMMPSTELRNALPSAWVDRLFGRFSALYGRHWLEMWADVPMADVKDAWATELAGFTGEQIAAALKSMGKFPPTLPEFVDLCKPVIVPAAQRQYLPPPRVPRLEAAPSVKLVIDAGPVPHRSPKQWAHDILTRQQMGQRLLPVQVQFAREALGLLEVERADSQSSDVICP